MGHMKLGGDSGQRKGKTLLYTPPLGFYPTITALKACFHAHSMVGKEKVRDQERSKESENNQLARRRR